MTNNPSNPNEPKVLQSIDLDLFLTPAPSSAPVSVAAKIATPMPDADRITVLGIMIDDSGSMCHVVPAVLEGMQLCTDALRGAKGSDFYLYIQGFRQTYFNGLLKDFSTSQSLVQYKASHRETPLYSTAILVLDAVHAKAKLYREMGIPTTSAFFAITDGSPNGYSAGHPARFQEKIESGDYIAAMGIVTDESTSDMFNSVFREMGIQHILTPSASPSQLRRAFNQVSQSVASISVK